MEKKMTYTYTKEEAFQKAVLFDKVVEQLKLEIASYQGAPTSDNADGARAALEMLNNIINLLQQIPFSSEEIKQ